MFDTTTLARPYALAAFEQARHENALQSWADMLNLAASISRDTTVTAFLNNPLLSRTNIVEMILSVGENRFSPEMIHLLRLLSENDRLLILPEIAVLFEKLKFDAEKWVEVLVTSAYPLEASQEQLLKQALEKRFGRTVSITVSLDESIIGGAVVHIGDVVIDGSMRTGLSQMAMDLRH